MTSTFFGNLSQSFLSLLENNEEYNIIIEIGNGSLKQSFKAHASILCCRCPHLYNELKDGKGNIRTITKPNIPVKAFGIIIKSLPSDIKISSKVLPTRKTPDSLYPESKIAAIIENEEYGPRFGATDLS
ncbi:9771_t:CDS:2, partial [Acaulospora morrowiae]